MYSETVHSSNFKRFLYMIFMSFANFFCPNYGWGIRFRGFLTSLLIPVCGKNLKISSQVQIEDPDHLKIGDNVFIGFNSFIGSGPVTIEDEVIIGPFVSITAGNHQFINNSIRFGPMKYSPIKIGKGSWLGAHTTIVSGVTIGKANIIAANAVVTKSTPNKAIMAGIPAVKIKNITNLKS